MLHFAVVLFVIALVAALFGFGSLAARVVAMAEIFFVLFALLSVANFVSGLLRKR